MRIFIVPTTFINDKKYILSADFEFYIWQPSKMLKLSIEIRCEPNIYIA